MYKISAPVMNETVTEKTREIYLKQCKEAKINRLFIAIDSYKIYDEKLLKENIDFFKQNGVEPAIWVGATIGHSGAITDEPCDKDGKIHSPFFSFRVRPATYTFSPGRYMPRSVNKAVLKSAASPP